MHWRSFGDQPPPPPRPLTIKKEMKTSLFETIRRFSCRENVESAIMLYSAIQLAYIIFRKFHCDAIIPVVRLFWCVALEPTTNSKCKPGQSQWALLKLESFCDVIKRLFSTAMAGQDNVSAQKAFLEENGCKAGRCAACDVIISG